MTETSTLQLRFPLREGDLAGCIATLQLGPIAAEAAEQLVPGAEPCEGRCGARVAVLELSGDQFGILAIPDNTGTLSRLRLPRGLWEAAHDDVNDDGEPVVAVVFHDVERCTELRAKATGWKIAIDADCPGCGYPERAFDPATGTFSCSSLNRARCDYTSAERDA